MNEIDFDTFSLTNLPILERSNDEHMYTPRCLSHPSQPEKVSDIPLEIIIGQSSFFELLCVPFSEDAFEILNCIIEKTLGKIECLTSHFDTCCCRWRLYYGTPSIENTITIEQQPVYHIKTRVLQDLLMKMYKKTNNNYSNKTSKIFAVPEDSEECIKEFTRVISRREWSVCEIFIKKRISRTGQVMLYCDFNRLCGSRTTAMYIYRELRDNIDSSNFTMNKFIMDTRIPFLQFVEGITSTKKCEEHIYKYIFYSDTL